MRIRTLPAIAAINLAAALLTAQANAAPPAKNYIVEARDVATAASAVRAVGGHVTHELPVVNGVAAWLTLRQAAHLSKAPKILVFLDPARAPPASRMPPGR